MAMSSRERKANQITEKDSGRKADKQTFQQLKKTGVITVVIMQDQEHEVGTQGASTYP